MSYFILFLQGKFPGNPRKAPTFSTFKSCVLKVLMPLLPLSIAFPAEAYVLLSATKATLPVTEANPTLTFIWDGKSPKINEKEKFQGGQWAGLDDSAFMEQILTYSLNIWNNVPGAFVNLAFRPAAPGTDVSLDSEDEQFSIITSASTNLSTAAFAKPHVDQDNAETIKDCDISIADHATTAMSLTYTIIHELGHCLGLGHSHTNYNAIMGYARTPSANLKLGADDIAGLIYLYPDSNYVRDEPTDIVCGTIGSMPSTRSSKRLWWLLGLPLVLLLIRPQLWAGGAKPS